MILNQRRMVSGQHGKGYRLKVILKVTSSQCNSYRSVVAGSCERWGKITRAAEVCTRSNSLMLVEPWIRELA